LAPERTTRVEPARGPELGEIDEIDGGRRYEKLWSTVARRGSAREVRA